MNVKFSPLNRNGTWNIQETKKKSPCVTFDQPSWLLLKGKALAYGNCHYPNFLLDPKIIALIWNHATSEFQFQLQRIDRSRVAWSRFSLSSFRRAVFLLIPVIKRQYSRKAWEIIFLIVVPALAGFRAQFWPHRTKFEVAFFTINSLLLPPGFNMGFGK